MRAKATSQDFQEPIGAIKAPGVKLELAPNWSRLSISDLLKPSPFNPSLLQLSLLQPSLLKPNMLKPSLLQPSLLQHPLLRLYPIQTSYSKLLFSSLLYSSLLHSKMFFSKLRLNLLKPFLHQLCLLRLSPSFKARWNLELSRCTAET